MKMGKQFVGWNAGSCVIVQNLIYTGTFFQTLGGKYLRRSRICKTGLLRDHCDSARLQDANRKPARPSSKAAACPAAATEE